MATATSSKENFIAAAADHGRFTISGDSRACNKGYDQIVLAARELKKSSSGGVAILIDLLSYPDEMLGASSSDFAIPLLGGGAGKGGVFTEQNHLASPCSL
jgi:hypothetical protein